MHNPAADTHKRRVADCQQDLNSHSQVNPVMTFAISWLRSLYSGALFLRSFTQIW